MIFTIRALQVQLEESINPIDDFINHQLKDRELKNYKRNIYFTRIIGIEQSREAYLEQIHGLDDKLGQKKSYLRLDSLQYQISPKESERYIAIYEKWLQNKTAGAKALYELEFPTRLENDMLELTQKYAFNKVVETYKKGVTSPSESMIKNFSVKLLGWMGYYLPKLYQGESMTLPKVVYIGDIKRQELLFLYFLSLMGCDILYMNPKQDIAKDYPECHSFSKLLDYGVYEALDVPKFNEYYELIEKLKSAKNYILYETPHFTYMNFGQLNQKDLYSLAFCLNPNQTIKREAIKQHILYQKMLTMRADFQEFILSKLEETFSNSNLYFFNFSITDKERVRLMAALFTAEDQLLNLIESYDFTADVPKVIFYINSRDTFNQDDAMMLGLLHAIGIDVLLLVPNGANNIELVISDKFINQIKLDEFVYDLPLKAPAKKGSFFSKLFR